MQRFGFVVGWLLVLATFLFGVATLFGPTTPDRLLSSVIGATGFLVGVAAGIFLSPFNRNEEEAFQAYGKAISTLITGWLLAKADDLVKAIFKSDALLQNNGLGALRLLLFGAGVIGAAVVVFYHRRYIADRSDVADRSASVSVNPTSVTGGTSATGIVTLSAPAPSGGNSLSLSSDNASAKVPSSVIITAGNTTATFTVSTSTVTSSISATITVSYKGVSQTSMLTITP